MLVMTLACKIHHQNLPPECKQTWYDFVEIFSIFLVYLRLIFKTYQIILIQAI